MTFIEIPERYRLDPLRAGNYRHLVGLFDALGFRQILRTLPLSSIVSNYGNTLSWVAEMSAQAISPLGSHVSPSTSSGKLVDHLIYMDTILLYTDNISSYGLTAMVDASNRLLSTALAIGIPLRGAISIGELYVASDKSLYVGEGVADAHRFEQDQEWSGGVLGPRILQCPVFQSKIESLARLGFLIRYEVPCKGLSGGLTIALGWPQSLHWSMKTLEEQLRQIDVGDIPMQERAKIEQKISNTLTFYQAYKKAHRSPTESPIEDYPDPPRESDCHAVGGVDREANSP